MSYSIVITKSFQGYTWVNSYNVAGGDFSEAVDASESIVARERAMHLDVVRFDNIHVAIAPQENTPIFLNIPLSGFGGRASGGSLPASPESCAYVEFGTDRGRPGKKFYRYVWLASEISGQGSSGYVISNHLVNVSSAALGILSDLQSRDMSLRIGKFGNSAVGTVRVTYGSIDTHHGWYNRPRQPAPQ